MQNYAFVLSTNYYDREFYNMTMLKVKTPPFVSHIYVFQEFLLLHLLLTLLNANHFTNVE